MNPMTEKMYELEVGEEFVTDGGATRIYAVPGGWIITREIGVGVDEFNSVFVPRPPRF